MAYGQLRLLYNNLVTHDMITPSTSATGRTSSIARDAEGVATLTISGIFAGDFDLLYTIEIDSVTGGSEVGSATFKWRTSDTAAGSWEETGVTTSTVAYALSADGLGTGLSIEFTGATGTDCVVGDTWQFSTKATYGRERLLDFDRKTVWRATGDTSENLVIDLGSAQQVTAFVLSDHNLTSGASIKLQGNAADVWGAPTYDSGNITVQDPLYLYLDRTFQYWRVLIADAANPDGYIEAAGLFLGTYTTFAQVNAWWGSSQTDGYVLQENQSEAGKRRRYAYAKRRRLSLGFGNLISNSDIDLFLAVQDALVSDTTFQVDPLWIHLFYDEADTLKLMEWENIEEWNHTFFKYLLNSGVILELSEVVKV